MEKETRSQKYRRRDPEGIRAYFRRYYQENRERILWLHKLRRCGVESKEEEKS